MLKTTQKFEQYFGTRKDEIKALYKKMQEDKTKDSEIKQTDSQEEKG